MDKKQGLFSKMSPGQAFAFGLLGAFMFICTIGFFVVLALSLSGGLSVGGSAVSSDDPIAAFIENEGLKKKDKKAFLNCVEDETYKAEVQQETQLAQQLGVRGTPYTVAVGPDGRTRVINGAQPGQAVVAIINDLLNPTGTSTENVPVPPVAEDDHVRGDASAPVTLIEYSDFDCPYCKNFHQTMDQVLEQYNGQVKWVYRHFPLDSIHPQARGKAEASECAADIDKFWEFADFMFLGA